MAFIDFYLPPFPETPAEGAYSDPDTGQIDHIARARSRVRYQFRKPKYQALLDCLIGQQANELEQALWDLHILRTIDTSEGAALDVLGRVVGLARNGRIDGDYRRLLRAMISVRKSNGLPRDLENVALAVVSDPAAYVQMSDGRGTVTLEILGATVTAAVVDLALQFLRRTVHAGVRLILIAQTASDANAYTLARAAFLAAPHAALASVFNVYSTEGFPESGSLLLDEGMASEETVTYSGKTATTFFGLSLVSSAHDANATLSLVGSPGLGLGDSSNAATGGQMIGAWE